MGVPRGSVLGPLLFIWLTFPLSYLHVVLLVIFLLIGIPAISGILSHLIDQCDLRKITCPKSVEKGSDLSDRQSWPAFCTGWLHTNLDCIGSLDWQRSSWCTNTWMMLHPLCFLQFAFHPTDSTAATIISIPETVTSILKTKANVALISFNFSKAFNTIRHLTIAQKLSQFDLLDNSYNFWSTSF